MKHDVSDTNFVPEFLAQMRMDNGTPLTAPITSEEIQQGFAYLRNETRLRIVGLVAAVISVALVGWGASLEKGNLKAQNEPWPMHYYQGHH